MLNQLPLDPYLKTKVQHLLPVLNSYGYNQYELTWVQDGLCSFGLEPAKSLTTSSEMELSFRKMYGSDHVITLTAKLENQGSDDFWVFNFRMGYVVLHNRTNYMGPILTIEINSITMMDLPIMLSSLEKQIDSCLTSLKEANKMFPQ